jgi:hypothetical protein
MAKMVARNVSLFVWDSSSACQAISGYSNSVSLDYTAEAPEVTGFGDVETTRLAGGLKDWTLDFDGFYTEGASEIDAILHGIMGGSTYFCLIPSGSAATSPLSMSSCAICTKLSRKFGVKDAATISGTFVNRSGSMTRKVYSATSP